MSLEIRDLEKSKIDLVFEKVKESAEKIAADTGTTISFAALDVTAVPAPTDQSFVRSFKKQRQVWV
jgi:hypothetical protein